MIVQHQRRGKRSPALRHQQQADDAAVGRQVEGDLARDVGAAVDFGDELGLERRAVGRLQRQLQHFGAARRAPRRQVSYLRRPRHRKRQLVLQRRREHGHGCPARRLFDIRPGRRPGRRHPAGQGGTDGAGALGSNSCCSDLMFYHDSSWSTWPGGHKTRGVARGRQSPRWIHNMHYPMNQGSDMPFLILTRAGFDDIVSRVDPAGAVLHLNPGRGVRRRNRAPARCGSGRPRAGGGGGSAGGDRVGGCAAFNRQRRRNHMAGARIAESKPAARERERRRRRRIPAGRNGRRVRQRRAAPAAQSGRGTATDAGALLSASATRASCGSRAACWTSTVSANRRGQDSRWSNLVALYQRLESDEVAGARVRAHFQGQSHDTVTDGGGYFSFEIVPAQPLPGGWQTVELELPDSLGPDGQPVRATAEVIVPAATARFGIISDIDDTVLWTNVTNKLNMALMLARLERPHAQAVQGRRRVLPRAEPGRRRQRRQSGVLRLEQPMAPVRAAGGVPARAGHSRSARCCCANWACAKCSS